MPETAKSAPRGQESAITRTGERGFTRRQGVLATTAAYVAGTLGTYAKAKATSLAASGKGHISAAGTQTGGTATAIMETAPSAACAPTASAQDTAA